MRYYHTEEPFFCVKGTMMGWAVSPDCNPEIVEMCSEMIVGDVVFLADQDSLLEDLERRGATRTGVTRLRESVIGR